jgi:hypothetical protein
LKFSVVSGPALEFHFTPFSSEGLWAPCSWVL